MKILLLTFNEHEEKAIDKILATISDCVSLEAVQTIPVPASGMSFPGLEIRLHQRRVLKDGADIYLTRLEYGALCCLAASPGRVFTKAQIFESVWSMDSECCQSSVVSVICSLRKKIEPDSKNPTCDTYHSIYEISFLHACSNLQYSYHLRQIRYSQFYTYEHP